MLDGRNPIDEAFSSVSSFLGENQVKAEPPSSSSIEPWTHKADKIKAKDTSLVLLEENPESDIDVENVDKEGIAEENVINEEAENSKSMNELVRSVVELKPVLGDLVTSNDWVQPKVPPVPFMNRV